MTAPSRRRPIHQTDPHGRRSFLIRSSLRTGSVSSAVRRLVYAPTKNKHEGRMNNTYNYGSHKDLEPTELFLFIAVEQTCEQLGIDDVES